MVFLTRSYGLKSNNFFQHVYFDSFCREHNIHFVNPFLQKFHADYPNLNEHYRSRFSNYLLRKSFKIRLKLGMIDIVEFDDFSKMEEYSSLILKRKPLYCKGWYFRDFKLAEKYRHVYQSLFAPNVDEAALAQKYLKKSSKEQLIIAVHIRRGDYKDFLGGIYYFEDEVYIDKIKQLIGVLKKDCKVIIFTNDPQLNEALYHQHFKNVVVSNNSSTIDHYLMSKSDYIIGPVSTFSRWASYMGNTPVYNIESKNDRITLDKFYVSVGN